MHAWNFGRHTAEGGQPPPSTLFVCWEEWDSWITTDQQAAYDRLGHDTFTAWATRGWWAAHTEKERA